MSEEERTIKVKRRRKDNQGHCTRSESRIQTLTMGLRYLLKL